MTETEINHIEELLHELDEYYAKCLLYGILRQWDYDKACAWIMAAFINVDVDEMKEKGETDSVRYYELKAEIIKLKKQLLDQRATNNH